MHPVESASCPDVANEDDDEDEEDEDEEGPEDQECAMLRLYSLYYTRALGGFFDL